MGDANAQRKRALSDGVNSMLSEIYTNGRPYPGHKQGHFQAIKGVISLRGQHLNKYDQ